MRLMLIVVPLLLCGCLGGLAREDVVKHPDAPMLVQEVDGECVRVAIYDSQENELVEYGWVQVPEGWTIHKFDWENYIKERSEENE